MCKNEAHKTDSKSDRSWTLRCWLTRSGYINAKEDYTAMKIITCTFTDMKKYA